jgi:hypothetical protein
MKNNKLFGELDEIEIWIDLPSFWNLVSLKRG